ncbi:Na+-transporting NADH:ubiquinone oxidoreductase subunit NqrC [Actimicrobium sp. GrIS 1.19]|uniref:FMN-binding protein n=1 Tax=Actimicrobium sp. GrIS 1.19 TaxID=3071708 RepID=UPI002DFE49B1|nr:Na+-transporting NADH:ubiquinone oxidoreductase subunit NqrC [Actimicrobium sp. GrIS 1.19]
MNGHLKFTLLAACAVSSSAFATQYLSAEEAQKAMYPDASAFKPVPLSLTTTQMQQVEKLAGIAARSVQWRVVAAWHEDTLLGYVVQDDVVGKYELISYAVALNPDASVKQIEILAYRESHGFEIRNAAWRKQFVGKSAAAGLALGEGIANISGATLSATHVTDGVRRIAAVAQVALKK